MNSYRPSYDNRRGGRRGGRGQGQGHGLPPRPPPPARGGDWRRDDPYSPDRRGPPPSRNDNYRPPQGDFTFRMDGPPGLGSADNYRPGPPFGGRRGRGGRGRGRGGYPYQRTLPADRQLLRQHGEVQEDLVDGANATTYRDFDDLSDDEEAAMEISDQSDGEDVEGQPAAKKARHSAPAAEQSVPKWSNPDAETALPPEENQRKKKDVVKLIRKARMDDNSAARLAASTEAEDFISFDDFGEDEDAGVGVGGGGGDEVDEDADAIQQNGFARDPSPRPPVASRAAADPLGSRKRTHNDEIKPPTYTLQKKNLRQRAGGSIVRDWAPTKGENSCPWLVKDHSKTSEMSVWLHKEIVDFYDHVKPRDFEQRMRTELVDKLRDKMSRNQRYQGFEVRPFGSFMSGLYLPTADMDLVVCSKNWLRGGLSQFPNPGSLHKFKAFLVNSGLAEPSSLVVIAKARVPLVKYVDTTTGLQVDISFDKPDGPAAVGTFLDWKRTHPALSALVTIIKHFLVMRGLNEPVNGGIGSFSVSCMVMSMLQLMPEIQSGNLIPEHHLGQMLLEFFDLYGNRFDYLNTAIRVKPAGYVAKLSTRSHNITYKNRDRLSIIDPNNDTNDIAGGSSNTETILYEFSDAHRLLRQRMSLIARGEYEGPSPPSILEVILAGNYSTFRQQRLHLRRLDGTSR